MVCDKKMAILQRRVGKLVTMVENSNVVDAKKRLPATQEQNSLRTKL